MPLDRRPTGTSSFCPTLRPSAGLGLTLVLLLALGFGTRELRAELVYDNSVNDLNVFLTEPTEYGDEVDFGGSARVLSSLAFSVFGETNLPPNVRARFRIYRNDGVIPPRPEPQFSPPSTLLFQSDDIPVHKGLQNIRIVDVAVPVPNKVTWTLEIIGGSTLTGERAGLLVYHPPVVGRSFKDYWYREAAGFRLHVLVSGIAASFAAQFEALPNPPVTLSVQPGGAGSTILAVTGPIGTEQIIQSSLDQLSWRAIGLVNLSTNASGTFTNTGTGGATFFYRTVPSPTPGNSVVFRDIRQRPDGSTELTLVARAGSDHLLEASPDQRDWRTLDVLHFAGSTLSYTNTPSADTAGLKFFRTTRPDNHQALYLIQSLRRQANGNVEITCLGRPNAGKVFVEISEDLVGWAGLGSFVFTNSTVQFKEPGSLAAGKRFYRLRQ